MKFHERLKMLRDDKGFTQKHLAEVLTITISTISHYENGTREPSIEILIQMAEVLGVSVDYLIGSTDVNIPPEEMNKTYCKKISTGEILHRIIQLDSSRRPELEYLLRCIALEQFSSRK